MEAKSAFILQKNVVLSIIRIVLMMTRAAQTHLAGHMRPAGCVFETPGINVSLAIHLATVVTFLKNSDQRIPKHSC